jgi:hypothetical protein
MSLTNEQKEKILRAFYRKRLLPLAEKSSEFFPLGKDETAASYFIERDDDGNYIHEIDAANLSGELEKLWQGFPELAAPITELAESIKEDEEASDEVSPFIYAMF